MAKRAVSKRKKTSKKPLVKKHVRKKSVSVHIPFTAITCILFVLALLAGLFFFRIWIQKKPPVLKTGTSFNTQFKDDFIRHDWQAIWNLYAPGYQDEIESSIGKKAYLLFLQQKFAFVHIKSISLGACKTGQTVFPYGIERMYTNTCVMSLTISAASSNTNTTAQLPLFNQVPLILTKTGNNMLIVGGGPTDLQAPVLFPAKFPKNVDNVPILMYHRIAPMPSRSDFNTDYGYAIDVGLTITPSNFAAQMEQLDTLGYHTITPNDLFNHLYYNLPLPAKPVLLTFDDGRLSDYINAFPILLSHHFTATFMIPPYLTGKMFGYHNHNKYMNFDELKTLAQNGMFIENHSLKHDKPIWDIPPLELQDQLTLANSEIFAYTKYPIQYIAYPGRWPYAHWEESGPAQQVTMHVLSKMGFVFAFLDLGQNTILENSQFPYQIPRIRPENVPSVAFLF